MNTSKIGSKLAARMFAHPAMGSMTTGQIGAAFLIANLFAARSSSDKVHSSNVEEVLVQRGCGAEEAKELIKALELRRVIAVTKVGFITLPAIDGAIAEVEREFSRRSEGWSSRKKSKALADVSTADVLAPSNESPALVSQSPAPVASNPSAPMRSTECATSNEAMPLFDGAPAQRVPNSSSRISARPGDSSPVAVSLCCDGGRFAEVTREYIAFLEPAYPAIDVLQELRKAGMWLDANPKRRKTFIGMKRFITTWLSNATNAAATRNAVVATTNSPNGFGHGGRYAIPVATDSASDSSLEDLVKLAGESGTRTSRWANAM